MATEKKAAPKKNERASLTDIKDELASDETQNPEETKGIWANTIDNVRKMKNRVNTSVVDQSKKAEKWHKKVNSWPLKKLSKVKRFKQIAADVDAVQAKTVKHGYDLLRKVVNSMDDINEEILARVEKRIVTA